MASETPPQDPVSEPSAEPPAEEATAEPAPSDELADAAAKIGCTGWAQSADPAPHVDRWGTCDLNGSRVQLYLIPSDDNYRLFLDASAAYGVTEARLVRVGSVVAAPTDQTQVDAIRAALVE